MSRYDDQIKMGVDMRRYERMEREHDARQPYMEQDLIEALRGNVCRSYTQLVRGNHCGNVAGKPHKLSHLCEKHQTWSFSGEPRKASHLCETCAQQMGFRIRCAESALDYVRRKMVPWVGTKGKCESM
jgi:hypothetical protein